MQGSEFLRGLLPRLAFTLVAALGTSYLGARGEDLTESHERWRPDDHQPDTLLLSDDFESYPVGRFPDTGGWRVVHSGNGGTIVNTQAYTGLKAWRFDNGPIVQRDYTLPSPPPSVLVLECAVKVTRRAGTPFAGQEDFVIWAGADGPTGSFMFGSMEFSPQPPNVQLRWATPCVDCREYFRFHGDRYVGPEVLLGRWYRLKARLDLGEDTGSAWLDDQLVFSRVPLGSGASFHFAPSISIDAGRWAPTGVVWVDDVRVYAGQPGPASLEPLLHLRNRFGLLADIRELGAERVVR